MSQSQYFNYTYKTNFKHFGDTITLVPFADIHRDTQNCAGDRWLEFCEKEEEKLGQGENRLYLGVGDYLDFCSDSERYSMRVAKYHETTEDSMELLAKMKCDDLLEEIHFMKGRTIGLIEGNHYYNFRNHTTTTQYMCDKLECNYLGGIATVKLFIEKSDETSKEGMSVDILAMHHGSGGKLLGTALNCLDDLVKVANMDIYIQGHSHKRMLHKTPKPLFLSKTGKLKTHDMVLCNPGSYLLTYVHGRESYAVKRGTRPVGIGPMYIHMIPRKQQRNYESDRFIDFVLES